MPTFSHKGKLIEVPVFVGKFSSIDASLIELEKNYTFKELAELYGWKNSGGNYKIKKIEELDCLFKRADKKLIFIERYEKPYPLPLTKPQLTSALLALKLIDYLLDLEVDDLSYISPDGAKVLYIEKYSLSEIAGLTNKSFYQESNNIFSNEKWTDARNRLSEIPRGIVQSIFLSYKEKAGYLLRSALKLIEDDSIVFVDKIYLVRPKGVSDYHEATEEEHKFILSLETEAVEYINSKLDFKLTKSNILHGKQEVKDMYNTLISDGLKNHNISYHKEL